MARTPPSTAHRGTFLWRPENLPGVTLFRADGLQQRFSRHTHDEYALGTITAGALGFYYRGENQLAGRGEINIVVPGEAHTGHPALGESWSYRMFYIEPQVLASIARQCGQTHASAPFFGEGVLRDPALADEIATLHDDLDSHRIGALEAQSRILSVLATWIRRHARQHRASEQVPRDLPALARVHGFIEECWERKPSLDELALLAGLSPYHLLRAFTRRYGLPPHAYLIQCQLREARRLLDRGSTVADAAHAAGFSDQSHLNRHFKRAWGLAPGHYRNFVQAAGRRTR